MSADATTREIKAVDSGYLFFSASNTFKCLFYLFILDHLSLTHAENQKNLLSDAWRMNQVLLTAFANHFCNSKMLDMLILNGLFSHF